MMKKALRILIYISIVVIILIGGFATFIEVRGVPKYAAPVIPDIKVQITPERVAEGAKIAGVQCMFCHRDQNGNMTGRLVTDLPPDFGKIHSANITQSKEHGIGNWTDGEIIYFLRTGVRKNGQYAPIYMPKYPHLSEEDIQSVVAWLRSGQPPVQPAEIATVPSEPSLLIKFLCVVAFKPVPYPAQPIDQPDTTNAVAFGQYLVTGRYDCYTCHSIDFKTLNFAEPEKSVGYCEGGNPTLNTEGHIVYTANITPDEKTGIGNWTEDDFHRALKEGKSKNGKAIRYPMLPYTSLTDKELHSIWQYLRTIPKTDHEVDRQWDKDI